MERDIKLHLAEKVYGKYLSTGSIVYCSKFLKFLGFDYKYNLKILEEPVQKGNYYEYPVRVGSYVLYWRGWKFFNKRRKNGNNQESTHPK